MKHTLAVLWVHFKRFNWREKIHPKYRERRNMGWSTRLNEKGNRAGETLTKVTTLWNPPEILQIVFVEAQ